MKLTDLLTRRRDTEAFATKGALLAPQSTLEEIVAQVVSAWQQHGGHAGVVVDWGAVARKTIELLGPDFERYRQAPSPTAARMLKNMVDLAVSDLARRPDALLSDRAARRLSGMGDVLKDATGRIGSAAITVGTEWAVGEALDAVVRSLNLYQPERWMADREMKGAMTSLWEQLLVDVEKFRGQIEDAGQVFLSAHPYAAGAEVWAAMDSKAQELGRTLIPRYNELMLRWRDGLYPKQDKLLLH